MKPQPSSSTPESVSSEARAQADACARAPAVETACDGLGTAAHAARAGLPGRLAARTLALPIRAYRYLISPMLPPRCRFYPSCSAYALEALSRHGALRGSLLAAHRLCRCHPWNPGGVDPVPESPSPLRAGAGRWPAALRSEPSVKAD